MRILVSLFLCALFVISLSASPSDPIPTSGQPLTRSLAEIKKKIEGNNRNNIVASIRWAEEALEKLAVEPDPASELWFLTSLVGDLTRLGDYPKAKAYLERGQQLVARSGDQRGHFFLEIQAAALLEATEQPKEAMQLLDSLLPLVESYRSQNPKDYEIGRALGRGYRFRGAVLQTMGQYTESIGAYQKALKVTEELSDRRGQSIVLDQMGTLYRLLGRSKESVASHQQAIRMAEAADDIGLQAAFNLDLANAYRLGNNTEAQLAALNQALALAIKTKDESTQIRGMVNLADVFLGKKDYKAALKYADEALKVLAIFEDPASVAVCQVNRGIALNRLGNSTEGLKAIQEGLRHIKTTQAKSQIAEVTGNLAEEYAFAGDYRKAYETNREFKALSDELKRSEDQKHIADASAAFESDKKQIQIEGLQRERRNQLRLKILWIALGLLGFSVAGVLIVSRKKLQRVNDALSNLNNNNSDLIKQLQLALSEVHTLQGLIPICAHCKKIRDDEGFWSQMETYIQSRTGALFSHGICPDCAKELKAEIDHWPTNES